MYASIREYHTTDNAEVARRAEEGFVPIVRQVPGFSEGSPLVTNGEVIASA